MPHNPEETHVAKAALRAEVRDTRKQVPTAERAQRDRAIQRHLVAALGKQFPNSRPVVAAFCALPGEPGGTDLPEALQEAGYEVVLPVVKHSPRRLEWRTFTGMADLVANSMGILEPTGENLGELVDTADVAILPALALGSDGTRLGQGGGFYDRTLAAFVPGDSTLPSENVEPSHVDATPTPPQTVDPATTLHVDQRFPAPRLQAIWAVVDHSELRVRVPAAPHDLAVSAGITQNGVYYFTSSSV
ncbi:MAG TPA: 5-formyltetrahydrofolate cyclo-ligase [Corynebacterium urealyticum]|nr:5-formyltetrahydrofolate cyclo-ligase [Corynebacterium urealyticum]